MPFQSERQRRWMHANEPEMAEEWEDEMKPKGYSNEDLGDDDTPMPENFAKRDSQGAYLRNGDGWDYGPENNASHL